MSAGLTAVIWKEWRELRQFLRDRSTIFSLVMIAVPFVLMDILSPEDWREPTSFVAPFTVLTLILCLVSVTDAFAGERERLTLEALLATPLRSADIVLGKLVVILLFAAGTALTVLSAGQVIVAFSIDGNYHFISLMPLLAGIISGMVVAVFFISVGMVVSLKSSTVRRAEMKLTAIVFVILAVLMNAPYLFPRGAVLSFLDQLAALPDIIKFAGVVGVFGLADIVSLVWIVRQFRRISVRSAL